MKVLPILGAVLLSTAPAHAQFKDGYYSDLRVDGSSTGVGEPDHGLLVKGGQVVADYSFDQFGCMGRGCDFKNLIQRNRYQSINATQILRTTPNGKKVVVTWYKN